MNLTEHIFLLPRWFDYSAIREQCSAIAEKGFAVCFGTPDEVKRNVIEVNEILGNTGGFLIVPVYLFSLILQCHVTMLFHM